MPPVRSFSELELSAKPTNKLRLICLAQCEPLCSLDWYLNGRPFVGADTLVMAAARDAQHNARQTKQAQNSNNINNNTEGPLLIRREFLVRTMNSNNEPELGNFNLLEDVFQRRNNSPFARYTWFKETNLVAVGHQQQPALQMEPQAAELRSDGLLDANVFSKLEITYNQLSQLLMASKASGYDDDNDDGGEDSGETLIECRINKILDGGLPTIYRTSASNQSAMVPADARQPTGTFWHALLRDPNHWFPDIDEVKGEIPSGMSNEPLDLSLLYASANGLQNSTANSLHKQYQVSSSSSSLRGGLQSGADTQFVDEMQIRIAIDSKFLSY